jgi:undecaprenyl-diphosphatase
MVSTPGSESALAVRPSHFTLESGHGREVRHQLRDEGPYSCRSVVYNSRRNVRRGRDLKRVARRVRDLDRALFRALFGVKWAPLTSVMRAFTVAGTAGALWGFLAAVGFLLTGLEPSRLLIPWTAIAASWTVAEGAKYLFDRTRPFLWDTEIAPLIKTPSSSSFPSGHSATAAAGAITLSVLYPPFAPVLVLAGLLVVLSRVYLGVHFPFDVLAGIVIGIATSTVVLACAELLA